MNTPSPEQIEQARKWFVCDTDADPADFSSIPGHSIVQMLAAYAAYVQAQAAPVKSDRTNWIYEDQLPDMSKEAYHEWYLKSDVVHGVRMGPPVQPAYVYSTDYDALFELVIGGGEAFAKRDHPFLAGFRHPIGIEHVRGNIETRNEAYKNECFGSNDKEKFVRWCSNKNLEWIAADGEKERSGPSVEEVMEAWGATLDKWKHELKGDGFDTSAGHEAAYAEWIAAKARSAEGSVTA